MNDPREESALLDERQMQQEQCASGQHVPLKLYLRNNRRYDIEWPLGMYVWRCARCHVTLYEVPEEDWGLRDAGLEGSTREVQA